MAKFNTLDYFSPNLRGNELYKFFSQVLDHGLETVVFPEMDKNTAIYDPSKPSYDPIYILELLGQPDLADLITTEVDQNSVSVLLPSILDNKGMKDGVDLIFKLINVEIEEILYQKTPEGCSLATILLPKNVILSTRQIKLIDRLSRKVFPICVRLTGIANCLPDGVDSLGSASLDTSWLLDTSILDGSVGVRVPEISDYLWLRFCLDILSEMDASVDLAVERFSERVIDSYLKVFENSRVALDNGLILDMGVYTDYAFSDSSHSRVIDSFVNLEIEPADSIVEILIESMMTLTDAVSGITAAQYINREFFSRLIGNSKVDFETGNGSREKIHGFKEPPSVKYGYDGNYVIPTGYDPAVYESYEHEMLQSLVGYHNGQLLRDGTYFRNLSSDPRYSSSIGLLDGSSRLTGSKYLTGNDNTPIDWYSFNGLDNLDGTHLLDGSRYLKQSEYYKYLKPYSWYDYWSEWRYCFHETIHKTERYLELHDNTILRDGKYNRAPKL
ncbi:hypothetical protein [Escherichia phage EP_H11]|nr:hypothetical protein [Escherichia phage EP_H11]